MLNLYSYFPPQLPPAETPTKLFLETSLPTSASPYPSPSSAFYPPPIPANHEFANKLGTGLSLVGNKRYRGSGGSAGGMSGTPGGGTNGLGSPISGGGNNNALGPSSANSSRRGSASAPSPLATHPPPRQQQQQHLDAVIGSPSTGGGDSMDDSTPSHDRITGVEKGVEGINDANMTTDPPSSNPNPPTESSNQPMANATPTSSSSATPSTTAATSARPSTSTTSTNPLPAASSNPAAITPTSAHPNSITPSSTPVTTPSLSTTTPSLSTTSKRTSQILVESLTLTPIRTAPPSPGPSRRGSLIRRGSSRRWSRGSRGSGVWGAGSGALGASAGVGVGSAGGGSDSVGPNGSVGGSLTGAIGIGGMAGIGSAWFAGDTTGGTSSTVSEDGSLHSPSEEPRSTSTDNNATPNTSAASKRASRRLSAFAALAALDALDALASTAEGEVVSLHDLVAKEEEGGYLSPSAPSPEVVETETEPVTPATPEEDVMPSKTETMQSKMETMQSKMETETTTIAYEPGFSPLKPILVADFAFSPSDPRYSKRPLELLSRLERDALSPEERGAYSRDARKGEDEWEEGAEEEEEDPWGWIGVLGSRPRYAGAHEEEMTPRFGYGYGYSSHQAGDASTPTGGDPTRGVYNGDLHNSGREGQGQGSGGGEEGEFDPEIDPDSPLPPGIYRALYAFEAEGTAEMSLSEGQLVRVVGRGGGVGWAVVERDWRPENSGSAAPGGGAVPAGGGRGRGREGEGEIEGGEGGERKNAALDAAMGTEESSGALGLAGQALVPEGYLEIWMLDGEQWGARDVDDF